MTSSDVYFKCTELTASRAEVKHDANHRLSLLAVALWAVLPIAAQAQIQPDAGRLLQEVAPAPLQPSDRTEIRIQAPAPAEAPEGGVQARVTAVVIAGNSVFSEAALLAVLGDVTGRSYDLAGLRGLADLITAHYRAEGYPFARAYLPPQQLSDGALHIRVLEGRFGRIRATGDSGMRGDAEEFLERLQTGSVIENASLERTALVLNDLPGIRALAIMRPGQEIGTGDLDMLMESEERVAAEIGFDNHGNRYTGDKRTRASVDINSPFLLGDQIILRALYTDEQMWLGTLGYSLPIGGSGLRGNVGYAHTYYKLGKEFSSLDAWGTAKVSSAGMGYPVIRSQRANLTLSFSWQHKELADRQDSANSRGDKSSNSLPIAVSFDLRDSLGGGGVTYGALSWTHGKLDLDRGLRATDQISARTNGRFDKANLDLARVQSLPASLVLFGRVSAQWAADNLDSSERFGLGGANGVRAFPSGEGFGDEGWLAQVELRRAIGSITPYVFYDGGRVKINDSPWAAGENTRSISGAGVGLRYSQREWSAEASAAWRMAGGVPQSDTKDSTPRVQLSASYRF